MEKKEIKKIDLLVTEALDMSPKIFKEINEKSGASYKESEDPLWYFYRCGIETAISLISDMDSDDKDFLEKKNVESTAMGILMRFEIDKLKMMGKFRSLIESKSKEENKGDKGAFDKLKDKLKADVE